MAIIGLLSYKGGQAKTTSAVHLAGYLSRQASTCLIDCDQNRSALAWADKGALPFEVVDEGQTARAARRFEHLIIDTKARPGSADLEAMAANCDALVIPCTPDRLALDALRLTLDALGRLDPAGYRILLTICPPKPSRDSDDARATMGEAGLPVFKGLIPRAVAFQRAALAGCLVGDTGDPRAVECAAAYEAIGDELIALIKGTP